MVISKSEDHNGVIYHVEGEATDNEVASELANSLGSAHARYAIDLLYHAPGLRTFPILRKPEIFKRMIRKSAITTINPTFAWVVQPPKWTKCVIVMIQIAIIVDRNPTVIPHINMIVTFDRTGHNPGPNNEGNTCTSWYIWDYLKGIRVQPASYGPNLWKDATNSPEVWNEIMATWQEFWGNF